MGEKPEPNVWECWLWQKEFYRPLFLILLAADVVLALLLTALLGREGLTALAGVPLIGLFWLVYGYIGHRMNKLRANTDLAGPNAIDCLIVNGLFQSPGLAELHCDHLILQPVYGKRVELPLSAIQAMRQVRWFNGSLLIGKRGFILKAEGFSRLGFAIAASRAGLWKSRLHPPKPPK